MQYGMSAPPMHYGGGYGPPPQQWAQPPPPQQWGQAPPPQQWGQASAGNDGGKGQGKGGGKGRRFKNGFLVCTNWDQWGSCNRDDCHFAHADANGDEVNRAACEEGLRKWKDEKSGKQNKNERTQTTTTVAKDSGSAKVDDSVMCGKRFAAAKEEEAKASAKEKETKRTTEEILKVKLLDHRLLGVNGYHIKGVVTKKTGDRLCTMGQDEDVLYAIGGIQPWTTRITSRSLWTG